MLTHLACIMDGNRRWAKKHGWLPWHGHRAGVDAAKRVIHYCVQKSIPYLSLYTLSHENLHRRAGAEQNFMFNVLPGQVADDVFKNLMDYNVRIRFIGDRSLFPQALHAMIERFESGTAHNTGLQLNMLFCYGGQQEIAHGVKDIVQKVLDGKLKLDEIDTKVVEQSLWMGAFPPPDLIIRPGAVKRLSNFFTYQSAYSELYFTDCLWPDIDAEQLDKAVQFFNTIQRNFGA